MTAIERVTALEHAVLSLARMELYSADQPRDNWGRFGEGDGGGEAKGMLRALKESGGFTIDEPGDATATKGFAVAVEGHSGVFDDAILDSEAAGVAAIRQWVEDNAELLDSNPERMFIGGWHDVEAGKVVLDPVEVHPTRDAAVAAGRERNQRAIYDLGTGKEISTGGTGGYTDKVP